MLRFRFAEKQRLRGDVERCTGQPPRTWSCFTSRATNPSRSRTSAISIIARTSSKRMPGMAVSFARKASQERRLATTHATEKRNPYFGLCLNQGVKRDQEGVAWALQAPPRRRQASGAQRRDAPRWFGNQRGGDSRQGDSAPRQAFYSPAG